MSIMISTPSSYLLSSDVLGEEVEGEADSFAGAVEGVNHVLHPGRKEVQISLAG